MSYYRVCPDCGSHLDPGERCDCKTSEKPSNHRQLIRWARDSPPLRLPPMMGKRQSMPVRTRVKA